MFKKKKSNINSLQRNSAKLQKVREYLSPEIQKGDFGQCVNKLFVVWIMEMFHVLLPKINKKSYVSEMTLPVQLISKFISKQSVQKSLFTLPAIPSKELKIFQVYLWNLYHIRHQLPVSIQLFNVTISWSIKINLSVFITKRWGCFDACFQG